MTGGQALAASLVRLLSRRRGGSTVDTSVRPHVFSTGAITVVTLFWEDDPRAPLRQATLVWRGDSTPLSHGGSLLLEVDGRRVDFDPPAQPSRLPKAVARAILAAR